MTATPFSANPFSKLLTKALSWYMRQRYNFYSRAPNVHQQMCTTGRSFQRVGGLLSNKKVRCRNVSATFFTLSEMQQIPKKVQNAIFLRTVFADVKTQLGPTLNTRKVGAWRATLTTFIPCHFLLISLCTFVGAS